MPQSFFLPAPWYEFVHPDEREQRVLLGEDLCDIDGEHYFVRAHLNLKILDSESQVGFTVWVHISGVDVQHMEEHWQDDERIHEPPYAGWLRSRLPDFADTRGLAVNLQHASPGVVPMAFVKPSDHPLFAAQQFGIARELWLKWAAASLHGIPVIEPLTTMPPASENQDWICHSCASTVPGTMESCWQCEENRPRSIPGLSGVFPPAP